MFQASYIREQTNEALVIKVREYTPEVERKLKPLMDLREACGTQRDQVGPLGNPPMLKSCGLFSLNDHDDVSNCPELQKKKKQSQQVFAYTVTPRYGPCVHELFRKRNGQLSPESIYSLGIQVINILEKMHSAGYVYNVLKLENLFLDYDVSLKDLPRNNTDIFDQYNINIKEMDFATRYLDEVTRDHVKKSHLDEYHGNIKFSSLNQLKFHTTSRRDDMISLFYLLVFLFKEGAMPGIDSQDFDDTAELFEHVKNVRQVQKTADLCFGNTQNLYNFKKEVFGYRFNEKPAYDKLRSILCELRDA